MTLIRRGKVVVYVRHNQNLFILDFIKPGRAMIIDCGRLIYIVSKNRQIKILHCRLKHASNVRVIKTSKLIDKINIINSIQYKLQEVFIDSNLSKTDKKLKNPNCQIDLAFSPLLVNITSNFNPLCNPYVGSKSTKIVLQKNMTLTFNKLEEVYVDLCDPHNLLLFFGKIYVAMLYCKFFQKTWILYLRNKDKFVDMF